MYIITSYHILYCSVQAEKMNECSVEKAYHENEIFFLGWNVATFAVY